MVTRRRFLALTGSGAIAGGLVLLTGCSSAAVDLEAAPTIAYGAERCAFCGMSIDDARFAAAWVTPSGASRHYDDIGCMVDGQRRDGPSDGTRFWVHGYRDEEWLRADAAVYVISSSIKTPMSYGVVAFSSAGEARAAIPAVSTSAGWTEMLGMVERKG